MLSTKREIITTIISREEARIKKEREKFKVLVDLGLLLDSVAREHCEPCFGQEILAPSSVDAFMKQMARKRDFDQGSDEYFILTEIYPGMKKKLQDFINKYGHPADFDFETCE